MSKMTVEQMARELGKLDCCPSKSIIFCFVACDPETGMRCWRRWADDSEIRAAHERMVKGDRSETASLIPLTHLGLSDERLKEHCEHIISEFERYVPERVFEAKVVLDNLKSTKQRGVAHE